MPNSQSFSAERHMPIEQYKQVLGDIARRAEACCISGYEEEGDIVLPPLYDSEAHVDFF